MVQATRGKKGTRRKKASKRRTKKAAVRKWPNGLLLVLGVIVGIVVVVFGQWLVERARTPGTGLYNLMHTNKTPAHAPAPKTPTAASPKPTYDFYTILPEQETVLNDREWQTVASDQRQGVQYVLQVAAYNNESDADRLRARLALSGLTSKTQKVRVKGKVYYRVRLGPYTRAIDAEDALRRLSTLGLKALRLKVKNKS